MLMCSKCVKARNTKKTPINNVFLFLMPITDFSGVLPSLFHGNDHLDGNTNSLIPNQKHII